MLSSNDSSDNESLIRNCMEVVNGTFMPIKSRSPSPISIAEGENENLPHNCTTSQRFLKNDKSYDGPDICVPDSMKSYMLKKIGALVEEKIIFKHKKNKEYNIKVPESSIKLLQDAKDVINIRDEKEAGSIIKRQRLPMKNNEGVKQKSEEYDKIKASVVSATDIIKDKKVQPWENRKQNKMFYYKYEGNKTYLKNCP